MKLKRPDGFVFEVLHISPLVFPSHENAHENLRRHDNGLNVYKL